jgi:hypothetical protein
MLGRVGDTIGSAAASLILLGCSGRSNAAAWTACGEYHGAFELYCQGECVSSLATVTCKLVPYARDGSSTPSTTVESDAAGCSPAADACAIGCVDLQTDVNNCGACGVACAAGEGCLDGTCVPVETNLTGYRVIDAAYSRSLDRCVLVSDQPNAIHLREASSPVDVAIALPKMPTSVSVSPDGNYAAVGHDGSLSYVDLRGRQVVGTYSVGTQIGHVALAGNGYAYALAASTYATYPDVIDLSAGVDLTTGSRGLASMITGNGPAIAVSPDSSELYVADTGSAPSSLRKYSLGTPTQPTLAGSVTDDVCGNVWISKDGSRAYTPCGHVYSALDLSPAGMLVGLSAMFGGIASVDDWSSDGTVAVLGTPSDASVFPSAPNGRAGTMLQLYAAAYLTPVSTKSLPALAAPDGVVPSVGLRVFHDASGMSIVVLLYATDPLSGTDVYAVSRIGAPLPEDAGGPDAAWHASADGTLADAEAGAADGRDQAGDAQADAADALADGGALAGEAADGASDLDGRD